MQTMNRLTRAYHNARVEEFDENSKLIFMSDCHRGDGSMADEFLKNKNTYVCALEYYHENGFTYVEVGDGDEMWEYRKFKHIVKANGIVFSRIKRFHDDNRFIMLYGNHDMQKKDPEFVRANMYTKIDVATGEPEDLFPGIQPCEALLLRHKKTGQEILTVHGHQGDLMNDQSWKFNRWSLRWFWKYMHAFGVRSPSSPVSNIYKQHKVERNYTKWIRLNRTALICGHTHREKFPLPDEVPYFNSGCCIFPSYITCIEITQGQIQLVGWRVEADANRYLHIVRRVLCGPEPVERYHLKATTSKSSTMQAPSGPLRTENCAWGEPDETS